MDGLVDEIVARLSREQRAIRATDSELGFALVEVVVALAILALALGVILGVISNGVRQTDNARKLVEAGQLAQSLLARLGTDMPIAPGQTTGEFAGGYRWRMRTEPYGPAPDRASGAIAAYTVSVEVLWGEGAPERSVQLTTLRLAPNAVTR
jgi:general secretion pathway protein I